MKADFSTYLAHNVPEYNEYSKKYGTPAVKRINKMLQGIKLPCEITVVKGTVYKTQEFYFGNEFKSVEGYIQYFRERMQDIENELRGDHVYQFVKISSFEFTYNGRLIVTYEVQEHDLDYKKRVKENSRISALNDLIPLIQAAHASYESNTQERINEQRKFGIKKKMEALQRELKELEGE